MDIEQVAMDNRNQYAFSSLPLISLVVYRNYLDNVYYRTCKAAYEDFHLSKDIFLNIPLLDKKPTDIGKWVND